MKKGIFTSGVKYSYRNYLRIGPLVIKDGEYTYNFWKGRSRQWHKLWLENLKHRYKPKVYAMQNCSFMLPNKEIICPDIGQDYFNMTFQCPDK